MHSKNVGPTGPTGGAPHAPKTIDPSRLLLSSIDTISSTVGSVLKNLSNSFPKASFPMNHTVTKPLSHDKTLERTQRIADSIGE